MTIFVAVFVCNFLVAQGVENTIRFSMKASALPSTVAIGQKVKLQCEFVFPKNHSDFSPLWVNPQNKDVSEQCSLYEPSTNMKAICNNKDHKQATKHKIYIKNVEWSHRGTWMCRYAQNSSKVFLDVQVPPPVHQIFVASMPGAKSALVGVGSKDAPYELRDNQGLQLTCMTECGYPKPEVTWKFKSEFRRVGAQLPVFQVAEAEKLNANRTYLEKDTRCAQDTLNLLKTSFKRTHFANCSAAGMDGLTAITCTASGPHYLEASQRRIYVLCPDFPHTWAVIPNDINRGAYVAESPSGKGMEVSGAFAIQEGAGAQVKLTTGEIVAIGFGGAIAILLIIGALAVIRRQINEDADENAASERGIVEV